VTPPHNTIRRRQSPTGARAAEHTDAPEPCQGDSPQVKSLKLRADLRFR
jgi:hypothetical protein